MMFEPEHPNIIAQMTPWDIDFRQIGSGRLHTRFLQHAGMDCVLSDIAMNRRVHQSGTPPAGFLTFGIPTLMGMEIWQASELKDSPLLTFGSRSGFESVSNEQFSGLIFSIAEDKFFSILERIGEDYPQAMEDTNVILAGPQQSRLNYLEERIKLMLQSKAVFWTEPLLESLVLDLLAVSTGGSSDLDDRPSKNRRFVLGKAIERMKAAEDDIMPISELCRDVGASWRTINRAFIDEFGVGPKAYYNRLRLNRVRHALILGGGKISVSDAANMYDFWHMGQFAKDYASLFGELPSVTVRRVKSQAVPGLR